MANRISRYRCDVALAMALSIGALNACGAVSGFEDSDADESAVSLEQPLIPGAAVTQHVGSLHLPPGEEHAVVLDCPSGKLVGGGYSWGAAGGGVRVYYSAGLDNGWVVAAANLSNTQSKNVDVYVQCLTGTFASSAPVFSGLTTIPAGGNTVAQVTCPAGTILAGGGFSGSDALHVYQNIPKLIGGTNTWVVGGKNKNSFQSITFQAQAICLSGVDGGATVKNKRTFLIPAGDEVTVNSSACPAETLLSSGGSYFSHGTSNTIRSSLRTGNPPVWTTTLVNAEPAGNSANLGVLCLELWQ